MTNAWIPLPTSDGPWVMEYHGRTRAINVVMEDDGPHIDDDCDILLLERDDTRYYRISIPPADGENLPRRFRWNNLNCVLWPNGEIDCEDGDVFFHSPYSAEQWLREHAGEIEWID